MAAPPIFEEGQSTYRPPRFNNRYYAWWKTRMHDFIMDEDSELWDVVCDGPFVPMKAVGEGTRTVPKTRKEYNGADRKAIVKNFKVKKILECGIGPDEYNRILACESANKMWEALQTAHEGTTQVKQSKIDMLTTEYELFQMEEHEFIQEMHTRFTSIIIKLYSLGEIIPTNKLVRKILSLLPGSWESKVNAITEAKDLRKLTIDELIGNLKTYEMKRKKDLERRETNEERNLVLKAALTDSSSDESEMTYLTRRFQKMVRKNGGIPKKGSSTRNFEGNDCCHKCGKPVHFIKVCPLHKQDHYKTNTDKAAKRNPVPNRKFKRRDVADNMVKQALADWGDSSSESEGEDDQGDASMMVVDNEYESIFALMAKSDDDEDKEEDEVSFFDVQRNLKTYSNKKWMSLANVLIDSFHSLINEKNALIEEIGDIEQERDDMVVSVVDLKEQVEEVTREHNLLKKQTIKWMDNTKGKEVASEVQLELESELKKVKTSLVAELEKNRQFQEDLKRVKNDLDKSLKWTRSSDVITSMYWSNGGNRQGIGFQKAKTSYNPHSKYVTVADNRLCTHCGQNCGKGSHNKEDEDGELTNAPGEAIDIANGKTDLMCQVKQSNVEDTAESPKGTEGPGIHIWQFQDKNSKSDIALLEVFAQIFKNCQGTWFLRLRLLIALALLRRGNVADNMLIIGLIRREAYEESGSQVLYRFWTAALYRLEAVQQHSCSLLRPN
ncbi:PREDICTED: uncharacterized protein LOC109217516 [Nicotiana attenuata]|uniref:uncharacterized protein LOC109217516 n=1 Tax=Nicotiana attenuata TaxID=49451 RepID=UPI000904EB0C|nr:PREDICTED: uncharacterized protein LOC109217516 [Nicotiana attenuata]